MDDKKLKQFFAKAIRQELDRKKKSLKDPSKVNQKPEIRVKSLSVRSLKGC